ncbi:hypothetical protein [uncultured Tessaracoccus sp.]|uniref:hypothetical protein n=1 Tax=uncultured Tessaracoccus sp. TaxID=905023 RepID=UPI0026174D15|nr:hypothetical protein [uncultured Tessaracoccus sp.]
MAIIGTLMLDHEGGTWRSLQMGIPKLSALMGSAFAAQPASRQAVERRWLVRQSRGRGNAPVWKLSRIYARLEWTPDLWDTVDALVEGRSNLAGDLVRSASHPAWDALGATAWLAAIEQALVPHPTILSTNARKAARALLTEWGYPHPDVAQLAEWLDRVATESGAAEARRELAHEQAEAARRRTESLEQVRAIRAAVPPAPDAAAALPGWFEAMLRLMHQYPEHAAEVERTLLRRVDKRHNNAQARWLSWLVSMWVEHAPVAPDDDPAKVRRRREAVAPAVVQALTTTDAVELCDSPLMPRSPDGSVPSAAIEAAESGRDWVNRKRRPTAKEDAA